MNSDILDNIGWQRRATERHEGLVSPFETLVARRPQSPLVWSKDGFQANRVRKSEWFDIPSATRSGVNLCKLPSDSVLRVHHRLAWRMSMGSCREQYEDCNSIKIPKQSAPVVRACERSQLHYLPGWNHPRFPALCRISRIRGHTETANRHNAHETARARATNGDLKMEMNSEQMVVAGVNPHACPACFVCKKQMADSQWFCRLTQKVTETPAPQAAKILLCSPTCALSYFGESQPNGSPRP